MGKRRKTTVLKLTMNGTTSVAGNMAVSNFQQCNIVRIQPFRGATEEFHVGDLIVGHLKNAHADTINSNVKSLIWEANSSDFSLVFDNNTTINVCTNFYKDLLKELLTCNAFVVNVRCINEDVVVSFYFSSLPLKRFNGTTGKTIKDVFRLVHKIFHMDTDEEVPIPDNIMDISRFYKCIKELQINELKLDEGNVQHQKLKPILREYQEKSVRWMLHRETLPLQTDIFHPLYTRVTLKSGLDVYFNPYSGYVSSEMPLLTPGSRGGILGDEMGLGKTVEVLACILLNRKPNLPDELNTIAPNDKETPCGHSLSNKRKFEGKEYPEISLKKLKKNENDEIIDDDADDELEVQCICGYLFEIDAIKCEECGKGQHKACMKYTDRETHGKYVCPQCWLDEPQVETKATLIVTPTVLRNQWCEEMQKHVEGDFKVLLYEGHSVTPVYPTQLKEYDVVITTYNVLQQELKLTERLRKKYMPSCTPLTLMKWWRLCLDEAQTVEAPTKKVSIMTKKICAHLRWAVTGTPISKDICELYGLVDYLHITPYNDIETWENILYQPYTKGKAEALLNFFSQVLWRTSKESVLDQINIPAQTIQEHMLTFSAVEKHYYVKEHEASYREFMKGVNRYNESFGHDEIIQNIERNKLNKLLAPLSAIREACALPNASRGRYLDNKKQVNCMKDLFDALISKNTNDAEEALRVVVSALNGIAGIHLLLGETDPAVVTYREVLDLAERYDGQESRVVVDNLQLIHAMHNLAETLEETNDDEENLKIKCADLEDGYLQKFMRECFGAYESTLNYGSIITKCKSKFELQPGQWYVNGLDWLHCKNFDAELLLKIENLVDVAQVGPNVKPDRGKMLSMIIDWDDDIAQLRTETYDAIKILYKINGCTQKVTIDREIVMDAMNCHLRPEEDVPRTQKCLLCRANAALKKYEARLFPMKTKNVDSDDFSLVGSWKPTFEELMLKALLMVLKSKKAEENICKDGDIHMSLIEHIKKEFKELRRFWTLLDRQVCAKDELEMCKLRLEVNLDEDSDVDSDNVVPMKMSRILKSLSYDTKNKIEHINQLSQYELVHQRVLLKAEQQENEQKLRKSLGTLSYLETMRKQQYEGANLDPCPICKNELDQQYCTFECGHIFCLMCIQTLAVRMNNILCSVCRNVQDVKEIFYMKCGDIESNDIVINGNYSTKIDAIVRLAIGLKRREPGVKILMFSSWTSVLKVLKLALEKNEVRTELASTGCFQRSISKFKDKDLEITVLLMPVNAGSKGLNLIEATHLVLVEPLLNPADELQALGRVHRIGQTRPTVVHKFVIKDTIEETLYRAIASDRTEWEENVTLQQLTGLFRF